MTMCTNDVHTASQDASSSGVAIQERIVYLAPDLTDAAVKKRAHAFLAGGHELLSFSFRRDRYDVGGQADWPNIELGTSTERRLVTRVLLIFQAALAIFRHRHAWRRATMIYARNLDLALLALVGRWITWARAPLIYEVLDVHPLLTRADVRGACLRWLERRVLASCRLLVVSSPAFDREYFRPRQRYCGKTLLLENKWSPESVFADRETLLAQPPEGDSAWVIGWFGNLRCRQSLDILTRLADAMADRVTIYLRGCDTLLGSEAIPEAVRQRDNFVYAGQYRAPDDLAEIYAAVHFNWCVDFADGDNSRWLIPNRIYEGGYFGVPALAIREFETGRVVAQRGLGITLEPPYVEHLVEVLSHIQPDEYARLRRRIEQLDVAEFVEFRDTATLIRSQLSDS